MRNSRGGWSRPILVWGGGAIGSTVAGFAARAGREVHLVDVDHDHVAAINQNGLKVTGRCGDFVTRLAAKLPSQVDGNYDLIFLCVKADQTESAILSPTFALTEAAVVSMQNGLCEHVIARTVGARRTVGATINFGAYRTEPGKVVIGNQGTVVVGELDGSMTTRLADIVTLLQCFEPNARMTSNIWGYLWGKVAYSTLIKASALDNAPMATFFSDPKRRPLHLGLIREVLRVAKAEGVILEEFDGFNPEAFEIGREEDAVVCLDRMALFFSASAKPQSTVWQELVVLKRKTDAAAQMSPFFDAATAHGLDVPATRKLIDLIRIIEEGRAAPSSHLLDELEASLAIKS